MLLERMKYPMDTLTTGEKIVASLQVTIIGIAIVFVALLALYLVIRIMEKTIGKPAVCHKIECEEQSTNVKNNEIAEVEIDNAELVAVIAAAISATLNTSTCNIVVKNIRRVNNESPAWAKAGRTEQIGSML